jgi:predicted metalloendopeptidase
MKAIEVFISTSTTEDLRNLVEQASILESNIAQVRLKSEKLANLMVQSVEKVTDILNIVWETTAFLNKNLSDTAMNNQEMQQQLDEMLDTHQARLLNLVDLLTEMNKHVETITALPKIETELIAIPEKK